MTLRAAFPFALLGVLAGCSGEPLPAFKSEQEKACYLEARKGLGKTQRLLRAGDNFVVVTTEQGFVKTTEVSPVFVACMTGGQDPRRLSNEGTLQLSQRELTVWDSLSDAQKRDALEFVRDGGTFADYARTKLGLAL